MTAPTIRTSPVKRTVTTAPPVYHPPLTYWLPSLARVQAEYPPELLAATRAAYVAKVRQMNDPDGSDTGMEAQLNDSGYGSQGVM